MATTTVAQFTGTLNTATYPNKYNVVIPAEGPFYRTGLKITALDGTPLIEGLDYYLGYYFKEATLALKDQIYGGFMLLTHTAINYTINAAGREYRLPVSEIGKALVSVDIKDPRNVDWSELLTYPPIISPIDPPANFDEAILRDEVVKALDDIRKGLLARATEMDAAYAVVTDAIFENGKKIFDDNLYTHHTIKNAHQYTAEEIGALKVLAKAVDATKAFGRTLDQLVDVMKTSGIQQTHIDTLMPVVLGELRGRMRILDNGALVFRTADNSHVVTLQGERFLIATTRPVNITADSDNNDPGLAVEIGAGLNTLYVPSGAKAPVFNGAYLVTPDTVSLYLTPIKLLPANAHFESTDQVTVYGSGKEATPIMMTTSIPGATKDLAGLIMVTSISTDISMSAAISQKAVNALKETLDRYVDASYKVNGKGFVSADGKENLTLTAADIGLGNVDNTSPTKKPVTNAINAALATHARSDHTHTFSDLVNVPVANDTVAGLVQLWDAIDTTTNKLATSRQGFNVQARVDKYRKTVDGLLPAWTTSGISYGNAGFLPIPTVSNYSGFGYFRANTASMAGITANVLYVLRNGTDGPDSSNRVYYWYTPLSADGKFTGATATTFVYNPIGLQKYPGVYFTSLMCAGDNIAIFQGSDNNFYLVLMSGTMDPAHHKTVVQISAPDLKRADGRAASFSGNAYQCNLSITTKRIVMTLTNINNSGYWFGAWYLELKDVLASAGKSLTFTTMKLTYPKTDGDLVLFVDDGNPTLGDATTTKIGYVTQAGMDKWPNRNLVNYRATYVSAAKADNVRVRAEAHSYYSNTKDNRWSNAWSAIYNLDAQTGAVTLESKIFPLEISENGTGFPTATPYGSVSSRNTWVAMLSNIFSSAGLMITVFSDVYSNSSPTVEVLQQTDTSFYDVVGGGTTYSPASNAPLLGAAGSVYKQYMRAAIHLGGTDRKIAFRRLSTGDAIVSKYTLDTNYFPEYPGYGPDNERTVLDFNTWQSLAMTPAVWKNGELVLNGRVITSDGVTAYKTVPGTTNFTADRINIPKDMFDQVNMKMQQTSTQFNSDLFIDSLFTIQMFDIGGMNLSMGILNVRRWEDSTQMRARVYTSVAMVPTTLDNNGNVNYGPLGMQTIVSDLIDDDAATWLGRDQHIQSKLIQRDDGWVLLLGSVCRFGVVGDSRWVSYVMTCDKNLGNWTNAPFKVNPGTGEQDLFLMPETGYLGYTKWMFNGMYFGATIRQNTVRDFNTGPSVDNIIAGVKTAEGWILYITQTESIRFGSDYYTLPTFQADIRDLYPQTYQNSTFYMYVILSGGVPKYQLLSSKVAESDTRVFIGTVETDSERITSSTFTKVKRVGGLKQLVEHAEVAYRHDLDVFKERTLSPLGYFTNFSPTQAATSSAGDVSGIGINATVLGKGPTFDFTNADLNAMESDDATYAIPVVAKPIAESENSAGHAAGAYWVNHPDITKPNVSYRYSVPFTPSADKVAVDVYLPAWSRTPNASKVITVNGTSINVKMGGTGRVELKVTAGKPMTIEIIGVYGAEQADLPNGPLGFTVSDYKTATGSYSATMSSSTSTIMMIKAPVGDTSLPNAVWKAVKVPLVGLKSKYNLALFSFGGNNVRTPIKQKTDYASVVLSFRAGSRQIEVNDLRVNLMKTSI